MLVPKKVEVRLSRTVTCTTLRSQMITSIPTPLSGITAGAYNGLK